MKRVLKKTIMVVAVAFVVLVLASSIRQYVAYRSLKCPVSNQCMMNLVGIESAKERWAREYHKTNNAYVTWRDLLPYLGQYSNGIPVCLEGGTYAIGRIGEKPTCSIGLGCHRLSVPPLNAPLKSPYYELTSFLRMVYLTGTRESVICLTYS